MGDLYLLDRVYEERHLDQIDQTVHGRHDEHLTSMRSAIEPQFSIRLLERNLFLGYLLDCFSEQLEFLVESFPLGLFSFFLLYLLVFALVASFEVKVLGLYARLSVKLHVVGFLLA